MAVLSASLLRTNCVACGSGFSREVVGKAGDAAGLDGAKLYECSDCRTVFKAPWSTTFVPELYGYYAPRKGLSKSDLYDPLTEVRYAALLTKLKSFAQGSRLLDVGCGQGHFVNVAMKTGWDVSGIDLSEHAVAICAQFGLPVRRLDFLEGDLPPASFDVITMFELIEHLPSPGRFVSRAEQLLKAGGLLYLTTPNFDSLDRRVLAALWRGIHPAHLAYYSPRTIRRLIQSQTQLEIVETRTQNLSELTVRRLLSFKFTPQTPSLRMGDRSGPGPIEIDDTQALRHRIERSMTLKLSKSGLNKLLDSVGWGESMTCLCRKPLR